MTRIAVGAGLLALFVLSAPLAAQESFDKPFVGEVDLHGKTSRLNIRLHADDNDEKSPVMDIVKDRFKVHVIGKEGDWFAIVPPAGSHGCWIHKNNVKVDGQRAHVTRDDSPVRLDSRTNAPLMAKLAKGTEVTIHREHLGWYQISAPPGVKYYVHSKYVKNTGETPVIDTPHDVPHTNETATVRALLDEARADGLTFLRDGHGFELAISKFQKVYETSTDEGVKSEAMSWIRSLTQVQNQAGVSAETLARIRKEMGAMEADYKARIQRAAAEFAAAHQERNPTYTHFGWLESTPKYLNQNGAYVLLDRIGGKRVAFVKVTEYTDRLMNGRYRQFIKIGGTIEGKDDGIDVIQLHHVDWANAKTENPHLNK